MLSKHIDENISKLEGFFTDCGDFVSRKFPAGIQTGAPVMLYVAYLDMMTDRNLIEMTIISRLLRQGQRLSEKSENQETSVFDLLKDNGIPTADLKESDDIQSIIADLLAGDTVLFMDGFDTALVISTKGFPNRGVPSAETEVVVQGSKEAFSEVIRINTALVRRRIRDPRLKIKQKKIGRRSRTDVALMYIDGITRPHVLAAVEERLDAIDIDGILDSGYVEQYIEDNWLSPFPQAQLTERPDKAAAAILEGRIVIIVDNSPFVLIVPVTLNVFFQASEDYYNRWQIMSLVRFIRYAAACMAVALPGLYIAIAVYHPSSIPLLMISKMAEARQSVPFPAVVELLLMDAAFELLREAGIRLPSAAGSTIGIVGGLIIGQAAVEAGLVSPIVVIVMALAGISSFAIPHVSLTAGFRLVKYAILLLSAAFGLLGFWVGILITLTHLSALTSFGFPYLLPFAAAELNHYADLKDSLFRLPLFTMIRRPFFAATDERRQA